eukprot:gnl/MRDRNA2_/MRDRNA2_32359_c0_seq1.p1 gnl/MRDRNA2_/MRDRNA2_32359_c0~~gnl/MRDRNA2_/MRDRNA2_32359_c0_seq1.p1  ORF type:complete len:241 (+),score=39.74 gnl/MRDRNA2_/MRDRNA2_32359_c0_seq1:84-806(+)
MRGVVSLLSQIEKGLASPVAHLVGDKRAVVACILREAGCKVGKSVAQGHSSTGCSLEMFFILRSSRKGDRWSGQVAFPGGHVESGETDMMALAREVREEVGLDILSDRYRILGEVRQRTVPSKHGTLAVACKVILEVSSDVQEEMGYALEPAEVAACGWVNISAVMNDQHVQSMDWAGSSWPGVALPIIEESLIVAPGGVTNKQAVDGFILWGLTLGIVNDFLTATGLRQSPIQLDSSKL